MAATSALPRPILSSASLRKVSSSPKPIAPRRTNLFSPISSRTHFPTTKVSAAVRQLMESPEPKGSILGVDEVLESTGAPPLASIADIDKVPRQRASVSDDNSGKLAELHSNPKEGSTITEQRIITKNSHGEKLVGLLHDTGSRELVILCHGFQSSKESKTIMKVVDALTAEGISIFRFDFSGNGESEGSFQFGNYWKEVDDLRANVLYFSERQYKIKAIVGHSKGGNVVLLYSSRYHDISAVVNISGRFDLERGIEERLGKDFLPRIKAEGFIDVKDKMAQLEFCVTEESLMDRLHTDMRTACLSIDKKCRVLTVHGSADEIIPVEDALEIARLIPNHKLHIIDGADHRYTWHPEELASTVLGFLRSDGVEDANAQG